MNRQQLPIVHIIGLPWSGKTTLAIKLSRKFKMPIYRIGEFRSKFPATLIGETDAWVGLFSVLSKQKWMNCIVETTGLNHREKFLQTVLPRRKDRELNGYLVQAILTKCIKGSIRKFRDTYASYSLACGMPLQNLKDNLGHSDIRTQIYLQAVPRIKSKEIKKIFDGWK